MVLNTKTLEHKNRMIYNCGHTDKALPGTIEVKSITREGKHSTDSMEVCENCLIWYRKNNLIIDNDEQRNRWIYTIVKASDADTNEC